MQHHAALFVSLLEQENAAVWAYATYVSKTRLLLTTRHWANTMGFAEHTDQVYHDSRFFSKGSNNFETQNCLRQRHLDCTPNKESRAIS